MPRHGILAASAVAFVSLGIAAGASFGESPQSAAAVAATASTSAQSSVLVKKTASLAASSAIAKSSVVSKPAVPPVNKLIPVLVYHHVRAAKPYPKSTWSWKMSVTPSVFEAQMQWIADHGYTTIDLNTYVSIMKGEIAGPEKPLVITFDDNNITQYEVALPVLEKHGFIAVFYLITDKLGMKSGVINSALALDLHKRGQDIESHTVTHRALTGLSTAQMDQELKDSKATLEALLNKKILHVAYPGTAHNKTVRERAALAGYVTGTLMDPRTATEKDDFFKIPRIMMTDDTNLQKTLP